MNKRGAIYRAVHNPRYVKLAAQSAKSLKHHMPQLSVSLYTDLDPPVDHCFDFVERILPVPSDLGGDQMEAMLYAPYKSFVLLDADTWVCGPFWEIFELVENPRVDFAATLVVDRPEREKAFQWLYEKEGVPDAFPFFNSAFVAAQRTPRTTAFLKEWSRCYYLCPARMYPGPFRENEPRMRVALFRCSDLRVLPLPRRYAFGRHGILTRAATVIHWKGGEEELKDIERAVNTGAGRTRVIYRGKKRVYL